MKIKIEIECESINAFRSHLLDMFEKTTIYLHEEGKKEHDSIDDTDEFDPADINDVGLLDDNNCYGNRKVELIEE
jgi:hypothetical protein